MGNFLKNSFTTIIGFLFRFGIKAVYFILLARELGSSDYGLFASVIAVTTILQPFSSWGSGNLLVKYVSRDRKSFSKYWGLSLIMTFINSFFLIIILILLRKFFFSSDILRSTLVMIGIADLLLNRLIDNSVMAFLSVEDYKRMTSLQIISNIVLLCSIFFINYFNFHMSVNSWAYAYFIANLLSAIICIFLVTKNLGWGIIEIKDFITVYKEGFYFSVSVSTQATYNDIDKTILAKNSSPIIVGNYSAAYRIINFLFTPITAIMFSAYPNFFKIGGKSVKDSFDWAKKLIIISLAYSLFVTIFVTLLSSQLPLILGNEYNEVPKILTWLLPLVFIKSTHNFLADALTGSNFQKSRTNIQLVTALFNVFLCLLIIPALGWKGAAIASISSDLGLTLMLLFALLKRINNEKVYLESNEKYF